MRKNRFCTFTLIVALAIAALPATLAAAGTGDGGGGGTAASSLPVQQNVTLTIRPEATASYDPAGAAYTAYRVMSLTKVDGSWRWAITNGFSYPQTGTGTVTFDPDAFGTYPAAKLQNLADRLALQVTDTMSDKLAQQTLNNGSCSWTTDKLGIYLVCETVTPAGRFPASPFLVSLPYTDPDNESQWLYSLQASPKGSSIDIEKVIHNAKGSYINTEVYDGNFDTVAIGDTVTYQITTKIPSYTEVYFGEGKNPTFQLIDTMAKGLTLTESSIGLTCNGAPLVKDQDYTQDVSVAQSGVTTTTISLAANYLKVADHQNKDLVLTFDAVVNDKVSLADSGNVNEIKLKYSYDPNDPDDTNEITDDATVYSFGIEIEKFDGDVDGDADPDTPGIQKRKLPGAQFALYKETSKGCSADDAVAGTPYRAAAQTNEQGILDFKGLDAGTYYLKEVKAPDGYSLMTNPIKVEIIPDATTEEDGSEQVQSGSFTVKVNGTVVAAPGTAGASSAEGVTRILEAQDREDTVIVSAANHKGFSLPITGGRGIAIILMISAAGLVAATAMYVRTERTKRSEM